MSDNCSPLITASSNQRINKINCTLYALYIEAEFNNITLPKTIDMGAVTYAVFDKNYYTATIH